MPQFDVRFQRRFLRRQRTTRAMSLMQDVSFSRWRRCAPPPLKFSTDAAFFDNT